MPRGTFAPGRYPQAIENLESVAASAQLLFRALASTECRRIVFVGSCLEYAPTPGASTKRAPSVRRTVYGGASWPFRSCSSRFAREKGRSGVTARALQPVRSIRTSRSTRAPPSSARCATAELAVDGRQSDPRFSSRRGCRRRRVDCRGERSSKGPSTSHRRFLRPSRMSRAKLARQIGRPELIALGARLSLRMRSAMALREARPPSPDHAWLPHHDLASGVEATIGWWKRQLGDPDGCPLCRGGRTERILRLDGRPVHQHVTGGTADDARSMPRGDVTLALCLRCGFVFNSAFDAGTRALFARVRELAGPLRRVQRVSRRPHNRTHHASSARREDHCRDRLRPGPFSRAVDGEGAIVSASGSIRRSIRAGTRKMGVSRSFRRSTIAPLRKRPDTWYSLAT